MFILLKEFILKINLFKSDNELIEACNYLLNCLFIYSDDVEKTNRNGYILKKLFHVVFHLN